MFCAGTECIRLLQHRNEVPCVYMAIFAAQNYFPLRREASVRMQPAHNVFLIPTSHLNVYFHTPARSAKTWRLEASTQAFFRFFLLKNTHFLLFFDYFCTFLIYIANFWGAATVGSGLRALFDCFLVIFMLKYQGGHGVWPFSKDY